jgi:signal transduction histidine kinase
MRPNFSLRRRVILACTALGFVLSLFFAAATLWLAESYERTLVTEILQSQAQDYSARLQADPATQLPRTHRLSGYLRRPDGEGEVPPGIFDLGPGVHEDVTDDEDQHVGVFDTPSGRMYFVIDLGDIEALERMLNAFLAGVVLLGTLAAGWIGTLLANMTILPVRRLAAAVAELSVKPTATRMSDLVADDELGRLARAIDAYQMRLVNADVHERQFFADASHELRTPLAVMRGAAEVLLDDPSATAPTQRRLQRLDRGLMELTDLLDVMLGLARRRVYSSENIDCLALLRACAPDQSSLATALRVDVQASGSVLAPMHEAALVLRGVLRRLLPPDASGELRLRGDADTIQIEFLPRAANAGPMPPATAIATASDNGFGLTLIGRLAAQLGWHIEEIESSAQRRALRIDITTAQADATAA